MTAPLSPFAMTPEAGTWYDEEDSRNELTGERPAATTSLEQYARIGIRIEYCADCPADAECFAG